jgi:Tfp pilus assembly protein PilO
VTETKQRIPRAAVIALTVLGVLLVVAAGYFLLIAPQRSKLASTKKDIVEVQKQIDDLRETTAERKKQPKIHYATIYQITKAMPNSNDLPDVMLALVAIGEKSGISFTHIGSQPVTNLPAYQQLPIQLQFTTNFYQLSDFLYRLRSLVRVRHGQLDASGRLYAIDHIDIGPPDPMIAQSYPNIGVTLQVSAFVYGNAAAAAAASAAPASTDTTTTSTTGTDTTSTTTTPGATTTSTTPDAGTSTTSSALGATP